MKMFYYNSIHIILIDIPPHTKCSTRPLIIYDLRPKSRNEIRGGGRIYEKIYFRYIKA